MKAIPYIPIDDFTYTEVTEFDPLVIPHLPGIQHPLYELERGNVIREFCRRTGAQIGLHPGVMIFEDVTVYELDEIPEDMDILTLKDLRLSDSPNPLPRSSYLLNTSRTAFELQEGWEGSYKEKTVYPVLSLNYKRDTQRIESEFFNRWDEGIAAGITARLMLYPKKAWTNPEAAIMQSARYEQAVSNAKIAVSREFGIVAPRTIVGGFI